MTNFLSTNGVSNLGADITFTILMAVFCVIVMVLAVWLLTKYIRKTKYAESFKAKLAAYDALPEEKKGETPTPFSFLGIWFAIVGAALLIRFMFMFLTRGYRPEIDSIVNILYASNPANLGVFTSGQSSYPLITYIFAFFGVFSRALNVTSDSYAIVMFAKLPLILADVGLMFVVYWIAKKHLNEYVALILSGFVAFFPPFVILSSVWGSVYAIAIVLLVLTFYFLANKKMLGLFICYSLALLTTRSALYLFPIIATFVVYQLVKSSVYVHRNRIKGGVKAIAKDKEAQNVILIPAYIVGFWLAMWLVTLPLIVRQTANPFLFTRMLFLTPLANFTYFGFNALNVFNLFVGVSGNGAQWTAGTGITVLFTILFLAIIIGLVLLVYLTRKNRALLVFLAGYIYLTLSIFFIDFGAVNLIVPIVLFMLAFVFVRDKRILLITGALGLILTLNMSFIFMSAGFLNNLPYEYFTGGGYTGEILLGYTHNGWLAANLILSVLTILVFIYATVVVLDIAMGNKRKLLADIPKPTVWQSVKKFIKG